MSRFSSRGRLTISLSAIQDNYRFLQRHAPSSVCAAVVKAQAYGLGIDPVAQTLSEAGAKDFFVALIEEGIQLRSLLSQARIYVLNGFLPGEESELLRHNLIPVLNNTDMLARWKKTAQEQQRILPALLHVDTGLNRLGFNPQDLRAALSSSNALDGLDILYLMSHLACADTPDHVMNGEQRTRLLTAAASLPDVKLSLAASDGIFCGLDYHFDMIRPGAAIYGLNPTPSKPNPTKPVVQLEVPILQKRTVEQNGTVGYGATREVREGERLATVSLGYADGFARILSNKGYLFYQGQALPVMGRVSMDIVVVDISALPENALHEGDMLEVFGPNQMPDDLAVQMGTIGYEVMTSLGRRFERVYSS